MGRICLGIIEYKLAVRISRQGVVDGQESLAQVNILPWAPMKPKPKVGKPRNPYAATDKRWKPRATSDWFDDPADLPIQGPPPRPGSIPNPDIRSHVYGLIMYMEVPILRRVVHSILVFDHGLDPESVTKALKSLQEQDYIGGRHIIRTRFVSGSEHGHLYSFKRKPTPAEIRYLAMRYKQRQRVLSGNILKHAGEKYFRAVLIRSRKYRAITQERHLGQVRDNKGDNALDLVATCKQSGLTYGISVKNQNAWLRARDAAIRDCFTKAKAHGVKPWLVVPFATESAKQRCLRNGIRLTVLGRQIVPAEDANKRPMRVVIDGLRCVLGPQPFEYAYERATETFRRSSMARADVKAVRDFSAD